MNKQTYIKFCHVNTLQLIPLMIKEILFNLNININKQTLFNKNKCL
jgi:hypothetical protein